MQVLFKKQLTRKQWLSLLLLTAGCIVKHLGLPAKPLPAAGGKVVGLFSSLFSAHMLLLLVQVSDGQPDRAHYVADMFHRSQQGGGSFIGVTVLLL